LKKSSRKEIRILSREGKPKWREKTRPVMVGSVAVGGDRPVVIAGPCAVESREQILKAALAVKKAGADMLRGGAFKPRTSPYDFQGLGEDGLRLLAEAREETGLPVVTEALDVRHVELVARYADVIQVGTRNMHHFPLLRELGQAGRPVLLKRGFGATRNEWLCAAEYIAEGGNKDIILCERGVRRDPNAEGAGLSIDFDAIAFVREQTFLPVVIDPSHGTEDSDRVLPACRKAIELGAHGLLIEALPDNWKRSDVRCDAEQFIHAHVLGDIVKGIEQWRKKAQ
jgi:3-deoxy-7-phosphoheptulonate synthase